MKIIVRFLSTILFLCITLSADADSNLVGVFPGNVSILDDLLFHRILTLHQDGTATSVDTSDFSDGFDSVAYGNWEKISRKNILVKLINIHYDSTGVQQHITLATLQLKLDNDILKGDIGIKQYFVNAANSEDFPDLNGTPDVEFPFGFITYEGRRLDLLNSEDNDRSDDD